ncbi:hypothetical protein [Geopsychrobacter electrodiphilus]|uniref:hypothetical protein n=1 Tax=Geopsychrobacter electrodiphilus TaxID=225196 RepID=UPI00036F9A1C|nr:hypothetical protein [Geopsychrobacter electrodiphilus]
MKNIIRNTLVVLASFSTITYAAADAGSGGGSFLLTLFLGFFALIIVLQLIPAAMLFVGMLKGLFIHNPKKEEHPN